MSVIEAMQKALIKKEKKDQKESKGESHERDFILEEILRGIQVHAGRR